MSEFKNAIVVFDYTKDQINTILEETKNIDEADFDQVKNAHKALVKVRTTISKEGKFFREEAIAYNKRVLKDEKEYLAITAEREKELKQILDDEKERVILEAKKELLPMKREQLALLEHADTITDDQILEMSDEVWVTYYQGQMMQNQNKISQIKAQEQAKADQEARELEIRKEEQERAEKEKKEAVAKAKRDTKEKAARKAEKEKLEQEEKEKAEAEEKEKMEKNKKYKNFLEKNEFNESTDIIKRDGDTFMIYRLINKVTIK